jgi:hypothetical protein
MVYSFDKGKDRRQDLQKTSQTRQTKHKKSSKFPTGGTLVAPLGEFEKNQELTLDKQNDSNKSIFSANQTLYAQATTAPGGDPNDRCFNLLAEIAQLAEELASRYDRMLRDPHDLYNRRRNISDPPITRGTGDPGSWEGHQMKYREKQNLLREKLQNFEDDCDIDGDPWGYGFQDEYDLALEFVAQPAPEKPLSKDRNELIQQALELGAKIGDGVMYVAEGLTIVVLIALQAIALILGLEMQTIN